MSKPIDDLSTLQQSFQQAGDWFKELGRALTFSSGDASPFKERGLERPSYNCPLPRTGILSDKPQIVVGMLLKYVNLGAGWRHRLFVLQDGVVRYYKVNGLSSWSVGDLLDSLRSQGEVFSVGAEIGLLEDADRRYRPFGKAQPSPRPRPVASSGAPWGANGEIHLQVSTLRESSADSRKFYINTGTTTIALRTETTEDRWVWMEALTSSKAAWAGLTPTEAGALGREPEDRIVAGDEDFLAMLAASERALESRGVTSKEVLAYVQDLLVREHQKLHQVLVAEENKRSALLQRIYALENAKRELETALVVEGSKFSERPPPVATGIGPCGGPDSVGADGSQSPASLGSAVPLSDGGDWDRAFSPDGEVSETDDEFFDAEDAEGAGPRPLGSHARRGSLASSLTSSQEIPEFAGDLAASPPTRAASPAPGRAGPDPAWLRAALAGGLPRRRARLPPPLEKEKTVSLWSLIKGMVGKDLSRVCLPVYFNEPLSALEKTAEDLEYSELLDAAARVPKGSADRLLYVAAFAVSAYSATADRTSKPFNPLLGETYELVVPEKGLRIVSEKVVHHPTVLALHAEARHWSFDLDAEVRSKFWGRSIELRPEGVQRVEFDDGDVYVWNKVTTSINNLILGKIYVDHGGIMRVRGLTSGLAMRVRFKETGVFDRDPRQVRGFVERDGGGEKFERPAMRGHWDSRLEAELEDGAVVSLWNKNPPPPEATRYHLTSWAIALNEVLPGDEGRLAPTDSRRRPDQHFLELGLYDKANLEKQRLEHKQRAARKAAERGDPIKPRWFEFVPDAVPGEEPSYRYTGGYWESRETGQFTSCRDIFGPDALSVP